MKLADEAALSGLDVVDRLPPATLAGSEPGTAIRVCRRPGNDGQVRLEQLAYSRALGWYVQKTFTVPAELLASLATELRKADCLRPRRPMSPPPLRLVTDEAESKRQQA